MRVFRARLSDLEGLVELFNAYRMFYHQKSSIAWSQAVS